MADNVAVTEGSGKNIRTDDVSGLQHQIIKVALGGSGVATDLSIGAGNVDTGTPRFTLAADDPAVVDLAAIEVLLTTIDGVLDNIQTAVETIDNAVETSRLAVNPIASQSGVAAGAGSVGATTQRMTLASDDPAVVALQLLDNVLIVDDAAFTPGTTTVAMVGAEFDDDTPDSVDEGDGGALRMSARRELYAQLRDAAGNERGANVDASNRLTVLADLGAVDNGVLDAIAAALAGALDVSAATVTVDNGGTFAVQVDGDALTALQLIDDAVADEAAALGKGILIQADDGTDRQNLQIDDTSKGLKVELWGAGQSAGAAVQPTQADATGNGTNGLVTTGLLYGFNGTTWDRLRSSITEGLLVQLGPTDNGVLDAIAASLALLDNAIPSGNELQVDVVGALPAGSNLIGDVGLQPRAANGLTTKMCSSADSSTALTNSAQAIKASAGLLYGYYIYNPNSTAQFVQIYNTASGSVTVGTTAPLIMLTIPPESAANLMLPIGITFGTAISAAATSTAGGNGAPTSSLDAVFWYN